MPLYPQVSLTLRRYLAHLPNTQIKTSTLASTTRAYSLATGHENVTQTNKRPVQSQLPLSPIGVNAALVMTSNDAPPRPKIFDEFTIHDRVAIVSGGNRGIGLEAALALCEAGSRVVFCLDLPKSPSAQFEKTAEYVRRMDRGSGLGQGRLEYISADVRDQEKLCQWKIGEDIGSREGRMDICIAAAGVAKGFTDCLEYPVRQFQDVYNVNVNGVLFTAQAAGRQMAKFGNGGSIVLIASIAGSLTIKDHLTSSYNTSKSAVLQMAQSMACELGPYGIRVNTLSPGIICTKLTEALLDDQPHWLDEWSSMKPLGRIGRPDELRGAITWLASDASTYCTGSDGGFHSW